MRIVQVYSCIDIPSEIRRELCKLEITISHGIIRYKVPVVGKTVVNPKMTSLSILIIIGFLILDQ